MTIGQRIQEARQWRSMARLTLAQAAEVTPERLLAFEHDEETPSSTELIRMANALDVATDYFFRRSLSPIHWPRRPQYGRITD